MDSVTIGRMRTRYRLPARGADGLRTRLDAVRTELLEGALEAALERAGARDGEEICIRRLQVPVRLRGVRGDSALAADWAAAIASALTQTLSRGGGDQAVRYGSRMQAWADCALGVARGDLGRAWAWRRLGLWRASGDLSPAGAAAELVRGLAFAPESVIAVLVGLATRARWSGSPADWIAHPGPCWPPWPWMHMRRRGGSWSRPRPVRIPGPHRGCRRTTLRGFRGERRRSGRAACRLRPGSAGRRVPAPGPAGGRRTGERTGHRGPDPARRGSGTGSAEACAGQGPGDGSGPVAPGDAGPTGADRDAADPAATDRPVARAYRTASERGGHGVRVRAARPQGVRARARRRGSRPTGVHRPRASP